MSENQEDLIIITLPQKKKKATDKAEVMASEEDKSAEGALADNDKKKKYKIYLSPEIKEEMRRKNARTIVVSRNTRGNVRIKFINK